MNALILFASKALNNKHTSGAALVYVAAKYGCPILAAWWPTKRAAIEVTAGYLEGLAVFYGFISAGDAGASGAGPVPIKNDLPAVQQPQPPKTP